MVASQDYPVGFADGYPTGGFQGLGGFVNEQGAELHAHEHSIGRADQGTSDDSCFAEQGLVDADFQFRCSILQRIDFLSDVFPIGSLSILRMKIANRFSDTPELWIVGVTLEPAFVSERKHLVVYSGRVPDAEYGYTSVH